MKEKHKKEFPNTKQYQKAEMMRYSNGIRVEDSMKKNRREKSQCSLLCINDEMSAMHKEKKQHEGLTENADCNIMTETGKTDSLRFSLKKREIRKEFCNIRDTFEYLNRIDKRMNSIIWLK